MFAALASLGFAARGVWVAAGSGESLEACEAGADFPPLSIVVPARNEQRQIERCVRSLLAQRYPDFEVVVVDDESSDRTRAILESIAREDARLHVVSGSPLPPGWVGKPWALHQGARAARGKWLLFTDADTIHRPAAAAWAVGYALRHGLSALSLLSTQELGSAVERIVLPSILWTIAVAVGPLDALNDPRKRDAALFNGQYIAFERAAYEALGGHAAVRSEIAEDFELAHLVKRDGRFRAKLIGASDVVRTRMYRDLGEIWRGFSKNLYLGARGNRARAAAGILLLACVAPLPQVLLLDAVLRRRGREAALLAGSLACAVAAAEYGMRRTGLPPGSGLWLPLGLPVTTAVAVDSACRHESRRGVEWRGRRYAADGA